VRTISLLTIDATLDGIVAETRDNNNMRPVILNLCDGFETDGHPGISVSRGCAARGLFYTGSDVAFEEATRAKTEMKRRFAAFGVPTAAHIVLSSVTTAAEIDALNSYPLIVKPSVSAASCGITDESVVHNAAEILA
jgi:D-alanine-D-alanine ligase